MEQVFYHHEEQDNELPKRYDHNQNPHRGLGRRSATGARDELGLPIFPQIQQVAENISSILHDRVHEIIEEQE